MIFLKSKSALGGALFSLADGLNKLKQFVLQTQRKHLCRPFAAYFGEPGIFGSKAFSALFRAEKRNDLRNLFAVAVVIIAELRNQLLLLVFYSHNGIHGDD